MDTNPSNLDLSGKSLNSWANSIIPKDEWKRGEKRALIDGTCYITYYDEDGNIIGYEEKHSKRNPQTNRAIRKDYVPNYNSPRAK